MFRQIVGCWGNDDLIERAFDLSEYDMPDELHVGPFAIRFCEVLFGSDYASLMSRAVENAVTGERKPSRAGQK